MVIQKEKVKKDFFLRDTVTVARELLGSLITYKSHNGLVGGYIVETEAYLGYNDPACHSSRGMTKRNTTMFQGAGLVYVYLIYGIYYCLNFTTADVKEPEAVLIRALEPTIGIEIMSKNRPGKKFKELCNGPGKLTQAMDIDSKVNGLSVGKELCVYKDKKVPYKDILSQPRIGISQAVDLPLRFTIKDCTYVSKK